MSKLNDLLSQISNIEDDELSELLTSIAQRRTPIGDRLNSCISFIQSTKRSASAKRDLTISDLSNLSFQVGMKSSDGSAILGYDGQLFLYSGNNNVIGLYQKEKAPYQTRQAAKWVDLVQQRQEAFHKLGMAFYQIVLPEPPSVIPHKFPIAIETPSLMLRLSEESLKGRDYYISGYECLRKTAGLPPVNRRTDTHLSAVGSWVIFRELLRRLGHEEKHECRFVPGEVISGDLSMRFMGVPIYEQLLYPERDFYSKYEEELQQVEIRKSPTGHTGSRVIYRNASAPIDRKLVVFGGSSFEFGNKPMALSWWAARWFSEFHFVWGAKIDYDYVLRQKPDIVVAQTIERFMARVPEE